MKREEKIEEILDDLVKKGSNLSLKKKGNDENDPMFIDELRSKGMEIASKDKSLEEVLSNISKEIEEDTSKFLNGKNQYNVNFISGISTCIYLPSLDGKGEYKLKLIGGKSNRDLDLKIDENTMFDVASVTKLFTLLLVFKLEEKGIINLNDKISDLNPDFPNLEDFTWTDLIRMHGEFKTNGRVADAHSKEEAYEILKTIYLSSNTREKNTYNDFGPMIMSNTLEKIISKKLGKEVTYDEIMQEYLIKPLGLTRTAFNPKTNNVSGNGNQLGLVHDPKARILGGALGHAGIFTTSDDLARLSKEIYTLRYINREHISRLGEVIFQDSKKGNMGIYLKNPTGYDKTFTPPEYSDGSFSHQGWTGALATFDPNNFIHTNILVNAIYQSDNKEELVNDKPNGYMPAFKEYLDKMTCNAMLMYIAKRYYNEYCNVKDNIAEVRQMH